MEIVKVTKSLIKKFVEFPYRLYQGDDKFVPYMQADQIKTLKKLLLKDKTYTALVAVENKRILGRILFTVDKNKQLHTDKCAFFSMFECVDDQSVCNALLDETVKLAKQMGAKYLSGTYFPYDQDNRRGILVYGFDDAPLIFTSYNKRYYENLLVNYGLAKQTDALEYSIDINAADSDLYKRLDERSRKKFDFRVDTVDWKHIDRDLADFHEVMQIATNEIIYQDAPSIEALQTIVKEWKQYLCKDYILIARSQKDNRPIGILMALPDFFEVFRKMRGKTDLRGLAVFVKERRNIHGLRAMLQYVIPQYQNTGVIISLYYKLFEAIKANGITRVEAGTIMEHNVQSNEVVKSVGGQLARVYRIYYKEI